MLDPADSLRSFSFADGEYLLHVAEPNSCVMEFRNWQEDIFRFVFHGVALTRSFGGNASLCDASVATDSLLIDEARNVLAEDWGTSGGPQDERLVELTLSDDVPVFSIVFSTVQILGPIAANEHLSINALIRDNPSD